MRTSRLCREPLRLLIVEDSEDDTALLCAELESVGARLVSLRVDSEEELRRALHDREWDIVICDHSMPAFSSIEALAVLKETGKDVPFIIYSGAISDSTASSAMREGVQDYVGKGDFTRLIPSIERELHSAAVRREKKSAESRVYRLAYFDELTGLPNRNFFFDCIDEQLRALPGARSAVICVDVDNFMRVNHTFGYAVGDALMKQVKSRLESCTESGILLTRIRGDQFAFFVSPAGEHPEIDRIAGRIVDAFSTPFNHDALEFDLTLSMGIAQYPEDGSNAGELLVNAETATGQAKRHAGTSYRYYDRQAGETAARRLVLESSLRRAIERNEMFLQYQPIASLVQNKVVGLEALVRWRHPAHGLLLPDQFIPIADETGLIVEIGRWVLLEACCRAKELQDHGFTDLGISVNVSAVQFGQQQLLVHVQKALAESRLNPDALQLEITESVLMAEPEAAAEALLALKTMGVRIAVDDFGTGYSSLSYLKRFPIDALKIDKSFTRDINRGEDAKAIVSAIVALARNLHLSTVAEGVETSEQRAFLLELGCDRMQGYLLSRPLALDNVTNFLAGAELAEVA